MPIRFARCARCSAASPECGDADLVARARAGDDSAYDCLFSLHYVQVYNFVRHISDEGTDAAEDIAQTAFVRAYEALPGLRDGQTFVKYLYRICVNLVRDRAKAARRKPWMRLADLGRTPEEGDENGERLASHSPDPETIAIGDARAEALRQQIAALPMDQRETLVLHHLQGLDVRAIAAVTGVAEGTVKSRLGRARSRLRTAMRDWVEGPDEEKD